MGFVSEFKLKDIYKETRIAIIPMRYGAGVKGKTVEAMHNGIPKFPRKLVWKECLEYLIL